MKSKLFRITLLSILLILPFSACQNWSKTAKGTVIGASAGALAGAVIGKIAGNTTTGAIAGAAVGGSAVAIIGNYMDRQSRELEEDLEGAKVERVGEGIKITFDSGILFDINSSTLKPASQDNIAKLSEILKKYEDTEILFAGHTDSSGSNEYNQALSERRAKSVAEYAAFTGVDATRMTIIGFGEEQPISSNDTVQGRTENRRVEVAMGLMKNLKKLLRRVKFNK